MYTRRIERVESCGVDLKTKVRLSRIFAIGLGRSFVFGGTVGALLAGVLCREALGFEAGGAQFAAQAISVAITWIYAGVMTAIFLFVIDKTIGLRPSEDEEAAGLDVSQHGEKGYQL